jgi:hypothetical protein
MLDEVELAKDRQPDDYERHLAAEIIAMIHNTGVDPSRVLAYVAAMLHVELPGAQPPAASAQTGLDPRSVESAPPPA